MVLEFFKYHGTGNDFILIDDWDKKLSPSSRDLYRQWCDRRYGVGADGLLLLRNHPTLDFEMVYFNSDGYQSSMCGNGGRCIVAFARKLGRIKDRATFQAIDGPHDARYANDEHIELKMNNVTNVEFTQGRYLLDTGSPHIVYFKENLETPDFEENAAQIRWEEPFKESGINVNFAHQTNPFHLSMRTYERGVEAETLSCGTGTVAVAIAAHLEYSQACGPAHYFITTPGGQLEVNLEYDGHSFKNIWLIGPAREVFKGLLTI